MPNLDEEFHAYVGQRLERWRRTPEPPRPCRDLRTSTGAPVVLLPEEQSFQLRTPLPGGRILTVIVTGAPPVLTMEQALQVTQPAAARIR